ncbi:cell division protein ZapA [Gilvimarinus agarilyticus]|uniref:cell division protein ZapA n=1 Tax=unclassified Gilvimarinus TaxID=2642066 RepID=UPI001C0A607C|nr:MULTISPECIES: cell division protein ZapA [unclassified Gilvimarinus]MBU2885785.1 cell division protein ZapA [Gilvimarinus agarilyticus]MDO6570639.1 cell division protein ZapA [Gilvimarinus sp. 2_MG-2023]MDO6746696.1 cell division protein ZapA [Gilvimarinus sp. 1_MG-2023]
MSNQTINVRILDKDYQVACPDEERHALIESAQVLDERMRMIKNSGSVIGLERIAVMAALNLSHELLVAQSSGSNQSLDPESLLRMQQKIEAQLDQLSAS